MKTWSRCSLELVRAVLSWLELSWVGSSCLVFARAVLSSNRLGITATCHLPAPLSHYSWAFVSFFGNYETRNRQRNICPVSRSSKLSKISSVWRNQVLEMPMKVHFYISILKHEKQNSFYSRIFSRNKTRVSRNCGTKLVKNGETVSFATCVRLRLFFKA